MSSSSSYTSSSNQITDRYIQLQNLKVLVHSMRTQHNFTETEIVQAVQQFFDQSNVVTSSSSSSFTESIKITDKSPKFKVGDRIKRFGGGQTISTIEEVDMVKKVYRWHDPNVMKSLNELPFYFENNYGLVM